MSKVINLLIFIVIIFALLTQINAKSNYKINKDSKQNIESNDAFEMLRKCANSDISACKNLINLGISNVNECRANECNLIGLVLMQMNDTRANEYLKKACSLQILSACKNIGIIFENTDSLNNAKAYYNDGCKFGDVLSCHNLGLLAVKMDNFNLARASFASACAKFYAKSCFNLAVLYGKNVHFAKDFKADSKQDSKIDSKSMAKYYFDKSCDLGLNAACKALQTYANTPMPTLKKHRGLYVKNLE